MAGGFKNFGPTYKATKYVRLGYEGLLNGMHDIDPALIPSHECDHLELAGKFAAIGPDGVKLAASVEEAVGFFAEDLGDMVNASEKASFYMRGGEYYVHESRVNPDDLAAGAFVPGALLGVDAEGRMTVVAAGEAHVGVVTHCGVYRAGNMYEWAESEKPGVIFDGDDYVGFIMII